MLPFVFEQTTFELLITSETHDDASMRNHRAVT